MKFLPAICLALLSAPAFAQAPRIDWSKPVVGVDAPSKVIPEDVALPVQVLTLEQVKSERAAPLPPPCEPAPTANAPAAKTAGPNPCPATR